MTWTRLQDDSSLSRELQQVLADRAALQAEKQAAEAAAARQQQEYELARAVLEQQLRQLGGAISSKEALIGQLQANETEARDLSEHYLVRRRPGSCWADAQQQANSSPRHP